VRENVTISHRGAGYEIGRAEHFYGIWPAGSTQPQPLEWWPVTPEGWSGAWSRFTAIETPGTIAPVGQQAAPPRQRAGLALSAGTGAMVAAALLGLGVLLGLIGLFPNYVAGASLAQQPAELVPHVIYLAGWTASAVLILLGGLRLRIGALLGTGLSIVTFGLFCADAGQVIAGASGGVGLWLGLLGWLACAAGSVLAFRFQPAGAFRLPPAGAPGKPQSDDTGPVVMLMLAALGTAIAFAPSWDSFVLRADATGVTRTITEGNAFANPAPVIFGNVAVMVALVAVVAAAALWRPIRLGAALLAGAIIPMAAQAISAFVQVGEPASPAQFGVSPGQAAQLGLTISSGLTAVFWIYCAFLVALIASFAWMLIPPHSGVPASGSLAQSPSGNAATPASGMPYADPSGAGMPAAGPSGAGPAAGPAGAGPAAGPVGAGMPAADSPSPDDHEAGADGTPQAAAPAGRPAAPPSGSATT
jgi:hypothetical protein